MFKTKKTYLIVSVLVLLLTIYLVVDLIVNWRSIMQTNRFRMFSRIFLSALFLYKSIDYFFTGRNLEKPQPETE